MKLFAVAAFAIIFCSGMGLLCLIWAVVTFGRGEYLTTVVVSGLAIFCLGLLVPFAAAKLGRVTPQMAFDAAGTTVKPDRGVDVFRQIWLIATVIATALFAVFSPLGKLDIPVPHEMRLYVPFASAATAIAGLPMLWRAFRHGALHYARLTSSGFEFAQGLSTIRGGWDDVGDVTDRLPGAGPALRSSIVMVMSGGQNRTLAAADLFTPDGRDLRELVEFYWRHPEHRGELTDGRALERLRDEQFDEDVK
jgi:hypothetical protein